MPDIFDHASLSGANIHVPHAFAYADATARLAASGFVGDDVFKLALQLDDSSLWILVDDSPVTWVALGGATRPQYTTINIVIDGGGSAIATGIQCDVLVDFNCTIVGATLLADQSGSVVVNIWKDVYANYPPVVGDKITASAPPTISSAVKSQDTTLTGWTTSITAGDTLRIKVDSCSTITRVTLALKVSL